MRCIQISSPGGASAGNNNMVFFIQIRCLIGAGFPSIRRVRFTSPTRKTAEARSPYKTLRAGHTEGQILHMCASCAPRFAPKHALRGTDTAQIAGFTALSFRAAFRGQLQAVRFPASLEDCGRTSAEAAPLFSQRRADDTRRSFPPAAGHEKSVCAEGR